jgi:hypothetical protein
MKRLFSILLVGFVMLMAGCTPSDEPAPKPQLTLTKGVATEVSLTFIVETKSVDKVAYFCTDNIAEVPSAETILIDGVSVEGSNEKDLKLFYTCLYHVLLDPRTAADADGRFVLQDESVEKADFRFRTMFSGWDVYRSEFPLLTVIRPDVVNDEVNSLLKIALNKNSTLPRWELAAIDADCMVGDPGLLVSADAYFKGIADFDIQKVFEISRASSMYEKELYGRPFHSTIPPYKTMVERAYRHENISITLEYLLFDYVMAKLAKKLPVFPWVDNRRSMLYVENFAEFVLDNIHF